MKRDKWSPNDNSWICSTHFVTGQKSGNPLAPNYVPSLFPQLKSPAKRKLENSASSFQRRQATKRKRLSIVEQVLLSGEINNEGEDPDGTGDDVVEHGEGSYQSEETCNTSRAESDACDNVDENYECTAVPSSEVVVGSQPVFQCDFCEGLENELLTSKKHCRHLELVNERLTARVLSRESLRDDDTKVQYYTGLPSYEILVIVFDFVTVGLPDSFGSSLCSVFEQFLMVLIRLRLNAGVQDLAYRFNIHPSTVCRYFNKWLDVLYTKLQVFINWPDRANLLKTMPMVFRKVFRSCAIIIDCFVVFVERPTSLKARAQTWSNYKKHNTAKFLIGISPQGSVSFISKGWGGRVSDVYLTEHSGLLQHLLPGDVVLADRGFTIEESVGVLCAEVKHPPFTRGKPQLSKLEIDTSRQLSQVRIHVERVIGAVRQKYMILQSTLPISLIKCSGEEKLSPIDKIVTVCCALYNHCTSVVPFN